MSTKSTLKWQEPNGSQPGYCLYEDLLDSFSDDNNKAPVYLTLEGVSVELHAKPGGGVSVTVAIPRDTAQDLGLLPKTK